MKLFKIYLFALLVFNFSTSNGQETLNQVNEQGQRIGKWKKYHPNGRIRYQGQFENGKEVGMFKYYSIASSDHPIITKEFNKFNATSKVHFYSEKGVLESSGQMEGKDRIGKWIYYHADGKSIAIEEHYKNGVLNGTFKMFYLNGKTTEIKHYKNGELDGVVKRYSDTGVILDDLHYSHGKLNGIAKYYNLKGELIYTGMYRDDEKVGKWEYYVDGKLENTNKIKQ